MALQTCRQSARKQENVAWAVSVVAETVAGAFEYVLCAIIRLLITCQLVLRISNGQCQSTDRAAAKKQKTKKGLGNYALPRSGFGLGTL